MEQPKSEIVIYQHSDEHISINVKLEDENVWLTQSSLVDLYQTSKSNVSEHIKHIFEEGELDENSVVRKFRTTAADGKNYDTTFYNLDLIISLGYRIKSRIATQFRIWATQRLKGEISSLLYANNRKKYPVRDYLSVETSILPHIRHTVGMLPFILLGASLRDAVNTRHCFYRKIHSYGMFANKTKIQQITSSFQQDKLEFITNLKY